MPHAVYTRNLGRNRSWRKATVRSLAQALIKYERIETTLAKAKEAQRLTEKLITLGKDATLAARRRAISLLDDTILVSRLFSEVSPRFATRAGGYTRIIRSGFRNGDGASMAIIELVERAPALTDPKTKKEKKTKEPPPEKRAVKPPVEAAPQESPKAERKKKPKGFLDGLRGFFKKDRPEK